jgi:hypothetical protein
MIIFLLAFCFLQNGMPAQSPPDDLPELGTFLKGVRAHLRSDRLLQSQYTFNYKETEIQLDKKLNPDKTEVNEYEVYPSLEEGLTYTRHISKNGIPLSREEIEKQDRKYDKKLRERKRDLEKESIDERTSRLAREAEEKRKEDAIIDELYNLYDVSMAGRSIVEGYSAILLEFRPRSDYKPSAREAKIAAKLAGRAWFCEEDYELMRVEVELIDTLSFGMGILARLNKGAKVMYQRRRINSEVWLPAEFHFTGTARVLLFKGLRIKNDVEFSNYKKFTVDSHIRYGAIKNPE